MPTSEPRSRVGQLLAGLASTVAVVAVVGGVPVALIALGGDPLPRHMPNWSAIRDGLLHKDLTGALFIRVLDVVGWLAWAAFGLAVVVEIIARLRHRRAVRLPGLRLPQRFAAGMVTAIALTFSSPALAATSAHVPRPPAAVAVVPTPPSGHVTVRPAPAAPTAARAEPAAPTAGAGQHTGRLVYRVKHGDYLGVIAQRFGFDFAEATRIAHANHIANPNFIEPGWQIVLPAGATDQGPRAHATGHLVTRSGGGTGHAGGGGSGHTGGSGSGHPGGGTNQGKGSGGGSTPAPTSHPTTAPTAQAPGGSGSGAGDVVVDVLEASGTLAAVVALAMLALRRREQRQQRPVPAPRSGGGTGRPAGPRGGGAVPTGGAASGRGPGGPAPRGPARVPPAGPPPGGWPPDEAEWPVTGTGAAPVWPPEADEAGWPVTGTGAAWPSRSGGPQGPVPPESSPRDRFTTRTPPAPTGAGPADPGAATTGWADAAASAGAAADWAGAEAASTDWPGPGLNAAEWAGAPDAPVSPEAAPLPRLMAPTRAADIVRLDAALRQLGGQVQDWPDTSIPQVAGVWLDQGAITLLLADDAAAPPRPFREDPNGWLLPADARVGNPGDQLAPLPALCTVGGRAGQHVLLDLEYLRVLGIGGDETEAMNLLRFIAVELCHNVWSDDVRVTLAGFGPEGPTLAAIDPGRFRVRASVGEAIDVFGNQLASAVADLDDVRAPEVLLLARPGERDQAALRELEDGLMRSPGVGMSVVVAPTPSGQPVGRYQMAVGPAGDLHVGFLGNAVMPAASLPSMLVTQVAALISAARASGDTSPLDLARAASLATLATASIANRANLAGKHRRDATGSRGPHRELEDLTRPRPVRPAGV